MNRNATTGQIECARQVMNLGDGYQLLAQTPWAAVLVQYCGPLAIERAYTVVSIRDCSARHPNWIVLARNGR